MHSNLEFLDSLKLASEHGQTQESLLVVPGSQALCLVLHPFLSYAVRGLMPTGDTFVLVHYANSCACSGLVMHTSVHVFPPENRLEQVFLGSKSGLRVIWVENSKVFALQCGLGGLAQTLHGYFPMAPWARFREASSKLQRLGRDSSFPRLTALPT